MVTAKGDETTITESILAGAKGFVVKPINEDSLHKTLKKLKHPRITKQLKDYA